jgi:fatty-acyl-CoA synthase
MDLLGAARSIVGAGTSESRGLLDLARTGILRPSGARHAARLLSALEAYGPIGAIPSIGAALHGDHVALIDERGSLSFTDLDRRSNAVANALRARGLTDGVVVGVLCRNHRGLLDAVFGTGKLGATTLLLNTDFSGPQLREVCARERAELVICDEEFADLVDAADLPSGRILAQSDSSEATEGDGAPGTLDALIESASNKRPPRPRTKPGWYS